MPEAKTHRTGAAAERAAYELLAAQGLRCLAKNYRCRCGEIDLIMRDEDRLIFVEVRYRRDTRFGGGSATVTRGKQQKIIRTAQFFLRQHPEWRKLPCRFDVVAAAGDLERISLQWIKNAFTTV